MSELLVGGGVLFFFLFFVCALAWKDKQEIEAIERLHKNGVPIADAIKAVRGV